ncbi:hypothetical protein P5V15_001338 [Pogonomyrmex californicus]
MDKHVNLLYLQNNDNEGHFICLHYFSSNEKLEAHIADCRDINECAIRLPSDEWLNFKNYCRKIRVPFIVYVNLECILEEEEEEDEEEEEEEDLKKASYIYQHHQVFNIGYSIGIHTLFVRRIVISVSISSR